MAESTSAKRERKRLYQQAWRAAQKRDAYIRDRAKNVKRARVSLGIVDAHGETPAGPCEICGKHTDPLNCDHNHDTGAFRGWLCISCNTKLGWYETHRESIEKYAKR